MTKCFYVPGETSIVDTVDEDGLSNILKESLDQVRMRHPSVEIWEFDAAWEEIDRIAREKYRTPPKEISRERWWEMLEILPPMKWRGCGSEAESFMVSEAFWGDLHSIFCRIGDRYFEMCDSRSLTHEQICKKCLEEIEGGGDDSRN